MNTIKKRNNKIRNNVTGNESRCLPMRCGTFRYTATMAATAATVTATKQRWHIVAAIVVVVRVSRMEPAINIYVYTHCISSPDAHTYADTQPKHTDIYASQVHRRILNRFYYHNIGFRSHVIRFVIVVVVVAFLQFIF